ncbi:aminotransferase class I/II-fold pyridoxal phosphate-dependent enzyme [Candidatus Formimonas warabiya]|uniref:Aminotransferase class I/II-fold pyridoxal phosphate-dependent enzyme n=1 Tax=Formimonas warabiya TaxID=1761012 RepID=A0A3G1KVE9_FORW1|nr:aminotransferase class I/II-fold pyridoxal phosphate-dependent enzyme [Candidatus Formimonas warabiya]ATW26458.1 hypothetical protein DCMF_18415 [Candidatus Formimonas warabiya]
MFNGNQNKAPLVEALSQYSKQGFASFHMPGHKGGAGVLKEWQHLLGLPAFSIDLTEVEGLDDLHHPTGPIRQAQELAADLMGAQAAFFLTNGVSAGIHALIMALCGPGDKIILPRHAHRSAYGALILSGAMPVYVRPSLHPDLGIPVGVRVSDIASALDTHPESRCLFMVHPTYHGCASDLAAIVQLARQRGVKVIADEAHGAHFQFSPEFPAPALQCGVSASVQGWHKTMGSLTQSALLLTKDQDLDAGGYLRILQSTSPSYLLMGSLDAARKYWAQDGKVMGEKILHLACNFRHKIAGLKGISCLDRESIKSPVLAGLDQTKLMLNGWDLGLNGFQLAYELRKRYGIEPEMAAYEGVTLMVTIGDNEEKLNHLAHALKEIAGRFPVKKMPRPPVWDYSLIPEIKLLPGQAFKAKKKAISVRAAAGEIAGEFICPYPPGIPLVAPGEVISRETIGIMERIRKWGGQIQGPDDSSGRTVRVVAG